MLRYTYQAPNGFILEYYPKEQVLIVHSLHSTVKIGDWEQDITQWSGFVSRTEC